MARGKGEEAPAKSYFLKQKAGASTGCGLPLSGARLSHSACKREASGVRRSSSGFRGELLSF